MKKLLLATALAAAVIAPAQAAQTWKPQGFYLSLGSGITIPSDSKWSDTGDTGKIGLNNSANFSGAIGMRICPAVRTELEISYRKSDLNNITLDGVAGSFSMDGSNKTTTLLVNGYYDFMADQNFSPYISAGIGAAHHKANISALAGIGTPGANSTDTVFAYQAGAGASFKLSPMASIWGGYRFLGTSDANFDGTKISYHANEINAGVRFSF